MLNENLFKHFETMSNLNKRMHPSIIQAEKQIAIEAMSNIDKYIYPAIVQAEKQIAIYEQVKISFKKYKNGLANFKLLVSRDWYISTRVIDNLEISNITEVFEFTKKSNLDKFEQYIISSFDSRKEDVFSYLNETLKNREHIIKEIDKLYTANLFFGLIPLCFNQADGISNENWGVGFFDSEGKKENYDLKIKKLDTRKKLISKSISSQLAQPKNELTRSSSDAKYNDVKIKECSINRHLIIHGHSVYYGNKVNAIKAILLLEFICDLINESFELKTQKIANTK